jgi:type IV pilus assembly protein PilA
LKKQEGFSLIELLIVVAIILIIAAIAIPNLMRSKIAANEASAVASERTLNTSSATYASTYGIGFPAALTKLGPAAAASSAAADLIDNVLATGGKSGYTFTLTGGAADANGVVQSYTTTAQPATANVSGVRYFFSDQSAVIRQNVGGAATNTSTPIGN